MSQEPLNIYGDTLLSTTGMHGGNISSQRIDELDEACLTFIEELRAKGIAPFAIDIGGGNGAHACRMAASGADVTFVDLTDQRAAIAAFNASSGRSAIRFHHADIRTIDLSAVSPPFHVIYSQRMMGCIRYGELRSLLEQLSRHAQPRARCFISASGLDTEYGADYPHRDRLVAERWWPISAAMAHKHQMYAPECLYRESELAELVAVSGFDVLRSWRSAFGTPKIVGEKP
jgi:cyclopropane fatty-acyl-phospholipid synthase-like methyltransferase